MATNNWPNSIQFIPGSVMFQHTRPGAHLERWRPEAPWELVQAPTTYPPEDQPAVQYGPAEDEAAFRRTIQEQPLDLTNHLVFADWLADHDRSQDEAFRRALAESMQRRIDTPWAEPTYDDFGLLTHAPQGPLDPYRQRFRSESSPQHKLLAPRSMDHALFNGYPPGTYLWDPMPGSWLPTPPNEVLPTWQNWRAGRYNVPWYAPMIDHVRPNDRDMMHVAERAYAGIDNFANLDPAIWPQLEALFRHQFDQGQRLSRYADDQPA